MVRAHATEVHVQNKCLYSASFVIAFCDGLQATTKRESFSNAGVLVLPGCALSDTDQKGSVHCQISRERPTFLSRSKKWTPKPSVNSSLLLSLAHSPSSVRVLFYY